MCYTKTKTNTFVFTLFLAYTSRVTAILEERIFEETWYPQNLYLL